MNSIRSFSVLIMVLAFAVNASAQSKIYWTDPSAQKIQRAFVDGTNIVDILGAGDGLDSPEAVDIDVINRKIYWADSVGDSINRSNLDGTSIEVLIDAPSGITDNVGDIVLDVVDNKMYWTDGTTDRFLRRSELNGDNVEILVSVFGAAGTGPQGLALDGVHGKIYWSDTRDGSIRRADLDGSNIENLGRTTTAYRGIAVDALNEYVYWANVTDDMISRADLNGTGTEDLVSATDPRDVVLDVFNDRFFFTDGQGAIIGRADLDGSGPQSLITQGDGILNPHGITHETVSTVVSPGTDLEDPPIVAVSGRSVILTLREFTTAVKQAAKLGDFEPLQVIPGMVIPPRLKVATGATAFRYDVRLERSDLIDDYAKLLSKNNQVAFTNLPPGNYTARYRMQIGIKRPPRQIERIKARGKKKGFDIKFKTIGFTGTSPGAGFEIQ